eukprot:TRINITY_DN18936_c0_g1_i1.p1 TRINITY_DN18936_c0_g1~~TRINITY_DN18936_c0_g1_i1.p1  ORF type:complete len:144 (-),score=5.30 TRINITY_DN18936_c0_g1_i1:385-816(-)
MKIGLKETDAQYNFMHARLAACAAFEWIRQFGVQVVGGRLRQNRHRWSHRTGICLQAAAVLLAFRCCVVHVMHVIGRCVCMFVALQLLCTHTIVGFVTAWLSVSLWQTVVTAALGDGLPRRSWSQEHAAEALCVLAHTTPPLP